MNWYKKEFTELSNEELYGLLKARVDVFVVEQACPYGEIDNFDQQAIHYYLKINDEFVAYVRILPKNTKYKEVSIGRVLVVKEYRGNGYAEKIMQRSIAYVVNEWKETTIKIQAQHYLKRFYSTLGFEQISAIYLEDEIPHIDMVFTKE